MSANSSSRIISFSTFEVNLETGELRQQGQKVKLQEQPFQVLAALLERPGEMVTREELRNKLWANRRKRPSSLRHSLDEGIASSLRSTVAPLHAETESRRRETNHLSSVTGSPSYSSPPS